MSCASRLTMKVLLLMIVGALVPASAYAVSTFSYTETVTVKNTSSYQVRFRLSDYYATIYDVTLKPGQSASAAVTSKWPTTAGPWNGFRAEVVGSSKKSQFSQKVEKVTNGKCLWTVTIYNSGSSIAMKASN